MSWMKTSIRFQAGLAFACNLKDRAFVGRDALAQKAKDATLPKRIGLVLEGRRAARQGADVLNSENHVIGQVTSGSFSPTLDKPIAMAYVESSMAVVGTNLEIDIRGTTCSGFDCPLPLLQEIVNK